MRILTWWEAGRLALPDDTVFQCLNGIHADSNMVEITEHEDGDVVVVSMPERHSCGF